MKKIITSSLLFLTPITFSWANQAEDLARELLTKMGALSDTEHAKKMLEITSKPLRHIAPDIVMPELNDARLEIDKSAIRYYAENLSIEELKQIIAFYDSPLGLKLIQVKHGMEQKVNEESVSRVIGIPSKILHQTETSSPQESNKMRSRAIKNNLRMVVAAAQQYMLENSKNSVDYSTLENKYFQPITPILGESYSELLVIQKGGVLSVSTSDGTEINFEY